MDYCMICGRSLSEGEGMMRGGRLLCDECFEEGIDEIRDKPDVCTRCGRRMTAGETDRALGMNLCQECAKKEKDERKKHVCASCGKWIYEQENMHFAPDGMLLCDDCLKKGAKGWKAGVRLQLAKCARCEKDIYGQAAKRFQGRVVCDACYDDLNAGEGARCESCKKPIRGQVMRIDERHVCDICYNRLSEMDQCARCGKRITVKFVKEDGTILCMECSDKLKESDRN